MAKTAIMPCTLSKAQNPERTALIIERTLAALASRKFDEYSLAQERHAKELSEIESSESTNQAVESAKPESRASADSITQHEGQHKTEIILRGRYGSQYQPQHRNC